MFLNCVNIAPNLENEKNGLNLWRVKSSHFKFQKAW